MARTDPRDHFRAILLVGAGGFAGAPLRYAAEQAVAPSLVATLAVNVLGCLALGVLLYEELYTDVLSGATRTLLATGFLGSFTTYSTFVVDAATATPALAVGYVLGSYALGFAAVLLGRSGARRVASTLRPSVEVEG